MNPWFLILAAIALGFSTVRQVAALRRAAASRRWPTTRGRVLASGLATQAYVIPDTPGTYAPRLLYEYRVGGQTYRGTRYNLLGAALVNFERAWARHRRLRDAEVTVWYDPADPSRAVLEPGASWGEYVLLAVAGTLWALVLGILLVSIVPS